MQIGEVLPDGDAEPIMQMDIIKDKLEKIKEATTIYETIKLYIGLSKEEIQKDRIMLFYKDKTKWDKLRKIRKERNVDRNKRTKLKRKKDKCGEWDRKTEQREKKRRERQKKRKRKKKTEERRNKKRNIEIENEKTYWEKLEKTCK